MSLVLKTPIMTYCMAYISLNYLLVKVAAKHMIFI